MSDDAQLDFQRQYERLVRDHAEAIADAIRRAADDAQGNEAQFRMVCDSVLAEFARLAHLRWEPQGERRVVWEAAEGRRHGFIDRLFDRAVVEFKRPRSLYANNNATTNRQAIGQLRRYIDALISTEGWESPHVAGVVIDGYRFIFCRYNAGQWVQEAPVDTSAASTARLLRLLTTFHRPPLLPELLVRRFGAEGQVTVETIRALYDALDAPDNLTRAVFKQWQEFFADIAGLDPDRLHTRRGLVLFANRVVARDRVDPARLLFALYTYSALLVKLLVVAAVTPYLRPANPDELADWAHLDDDELRDRLQQVESGAFYRDLGISNFTEGDFFGWYVGQWTPALADHVRHLITEVSYLDPSAVEQAPERLRDLLKRLYHGLFPREVRHDLGEYYTPDWLAERLLAQLDNELFGDIPSGEEKRQSQARRVRGRLTSTRFLDPACGSGTFLVLIIRRLRQWARESGLPERDQLLRAILRNVVGFDLNPLAVISARANILLSIVDLLSPDNGAIELPVYLADSIVLPAEGPNADMFENGLYRLPLRGVGRDFMVPSVLAADREKLSTLARLLRHDVEHEVGVEGFLRACENELALSANEWRRCRQDLSDLYDMITQLHRDGRNGIWADIARNMFMPCLIGTANYVVGNPPWVNWESLPQQYRDRSTSIWQRYGLFVHEGMDTILGSGKKDVSMLLTYVAADRYLSGGGKLGFVITQSVFKTSGAGQGFRRFRLGDDEHLKVLSVDDFSAMQPFEGATNRTALVVLQKGQPTSYPVPYYRWHRTGRRTPPFDASWQDVYPENQTRRLIERASFYAEPVDADDATSSWLTAGREALRAMRKLIGPSDYQAHAGAYSGGANAVYWLEVIREGQGTVEARNITEGQKREIAAGVHTIEPDLLYPLVRGRDVRKWTVNADPSARFLIVQDPATRRGIPEDKLRARCPRTYAYLLGYRDVLLQRRSQAIRRLMDESFYAMFAVGEYTFAPHKVVWGEVGHELNAAVIEQRTGLPAVPDHTVILIACQQADEAHYLCATLNSSPAHLLIQNYIVLHPDPHVMDRVRIPRYEPGIPVHRRLAELSRRAHDIAAGPEVGLLSDVENQIDECARELWGLSSTQLAAITDSLRELNG